MLHAILNHQTKPITIMKTRILNNQVTLLIYTALFLILILHSAFSHGQSSYPFNDDKQYIGLDVSFGTHAFTINSDILKINQAVVNQGGGQIGFIYGNKILRTKVGLIGYYSSVSNIAGTIDLYESNASANFYPLSLITKKAHRVEPYFNAGLAYDQIKFYGHYMQNDPEEVNYSTSEAPYIGKIKQLNATVGAGVELKVVDHINFINLFSEIRYGFNMTNTYDRPELGNTKVGNQMAVNIGVTFGRRH